LLDRALECLGLEAERPFAALISEDAAAAPKMPSTADDVKNLSWNERTLVIALSYATEIRAVLDNGKDVHSEINRWAPEERTFWLEPWQTSAEPSLGSDRSLTRRRPPSIHPAWAATSDSASRSHPRPPPPEPAIAGGPDERGGGRSGLRLDVFPRTRAIRHSEDG
jgi:hypothetical protein